MKCDIIMSHIFDSALTRMSLESIGSSRKVILIDNSFSVEMKRYAARHTHIHYIKAVDKRKFDIGTSMEWSPLTCAGSWNRAMKEATTPWVINVNPDVMLVNGALEKIEAAIEGKSHEDVCLLWTNLNFNVWAGNTSVLLNDLDGFDTRFYPCGGEDEDMLCRIATAGLKWSKVSIPAFHMEGGHISRVDGNCNAGVFVDKWGWMPHSLPYSQLVAKGKA